MAQGEGKFKNKISFYTGKDREEVTALLEQYLGGCSHAIAAIGYEPSASLRVNGHPLSHFKHNNKTTEIIGVPGLFGIGVAFPEEVTAISGEVEPAVGVGKFWATMSKKEILEMWKNNTAEKKTSIEVQSHFFTNMGKEAIATFSNRILTSERDEKVCRVGNI